MDRMNKAQIFIALTGLRVIIGRWRLESVFIKTPDMFAYGRFQMVVTLSRVVLSYSLWRMFKPGSVRLPEFKESNIVQPLPELPYTMDSSKVWSIDADDYTKGLKKHGKKD